MLQDPIQDTTLHCSVAVCATLLYGEYIHPPGAGSNLENIPA